MRSPPVALTLSLFALSCGHEGNSASSPHEQTVGTWSPPDAGIPPRPDAMADEYDGEVRQCIEVPGVPDEALPRCDFTTRTCIHACSDDSCRESCLHSDVLSPAVIGQDRIACSDCVYRRMILCIGEGGCKAEVDAFMCCIVEKCAGLGDDCIDSMCKEEGNAMFGCIFVSSPTCLSYVDGPATDCFVQSDIEPDAGSK